MAGMEITGYDPGSHDGDKQVCMIQAPDGRWLPISTPVDGEAVWDVCRREYPHVWTDEYMQETLRESRENYADGRAKNLKDVLRELRERA